MLIIDEMKIREDLVYDKTGRNLHGFVNLGDVNNQLLQLEQQAVSSVPQNCIATQMLTLMGRGIFIKLEFLLPAFRPKVSILCRCHWTVTLLDRVRGCAPSEGN